MQYERDGQREERRERVRDLSCASLLIHMYRSPSPDPQSSTWVTGTQVPELSSTAPQGWRSQGAGMGSGASITYPEQAKKQLPWLSALEHSALASIRPFPPLGNHCSDGALISGKVWLCCASYHIAVFRRNTSAFYCFYLSWSNHNSWQHP